MSLSVSFGGRKRLQPAGVDDKQMREKSEEKRNTEGLEIRENHKLSAPDSC